MYAKQQSQPACITKPTVSGTTPAKSTLVHVHVCTTHPVCARVYAVRDCRPDTFVENNRVPIEPSFLLALDHVSRVGNYRQAATDTATSLMQACTCGQRLQHEGTS